MRSRNITVVSCRAGDPRSAWITGVTSSYVDPDDPFPEGHLLPDTWGVTGEARRSETIRMSRHLRGRD